MNTLNSQKTKTFEHGSRRAYQYGRCRCRDCRAANALYMAGLRGRKARGAPIVGTYVSSVETRRQLGLLRREYDSLASLAQRLGLSQRLRVGRRVRLFTAQRVRELYERDILSGLPSAVSYVPLCRPARTLQTVSLDARRRIAERTSS